jgi:long-chain acyl-CoA synthetase
MREYSTPPVAAVPASARLTDVVYQRASESPGTVIIRRRRDHRGIPADGAKPAAGGESPAAAGGAAGWQNVTAGQFAAEVTALAKGLIANGVGPGDRVALMSRTRYEWTLADYAIWAAGAVTVPVYETSSAEQVEWILSDSGARALIAETEAHRQVAAQAGDGLGGLAGVWLIEGPPAAHSRGARPLSALAADGARVSDAELAGRRESRSAADLATIIYTSGTTGRPKGCQLSHGNLLADVRNAVHGPLVQIFEMPGASTLLFLPLAHSFARIIQVGCLEAGIVLGHTPDLAGLLGDLASFRPTFLLAVPRVFEKVYHGAEQQAAASPVKSRIFAAAARTAIAWSQAQDGPRPGPVLAARHALFERLVYARLRAALGGGVRYAVSGGAPLGERLGHFFRGAGITVLEGYGLTESSAAATVNRPERVKIGTVGQPLPGVSVRIADDGEICLAGPNIFSGYWRNQAATSEVLSDGWLSTGDLGELDFEGYLRVTGRKKEMIVTSGGKNVAPAVLEDRIRAHPLVSQCVVVGDGRPYVACLITLDAEALAVWKDRHSRPADATAATLANDPALLAELQAAVDEANKAVSRAEAVRRFRVLAADFTEASGHLTPSLKVRRSVVLKDFAAEIDALYT